MKGKLIVIEGTDCSGKETQCKLLIERLKKDSIIVFQMSFPRYDTPTGKIIGGPILGKDYICNSYFSSPDLIDSKVASMYYAIDRYANIEPIKKNLNDGNIVILDRYTTSNMGFHGGKIQDYKQRQEMYQFIEKLEYDFLSLPKPDAVIFLHMPYEAASILRTMRKEPPDKVEKKEIYLRNAEMAYTELAKQNNWITINCVNNKEIRTIEDINEELYNKVKEVLNGK